MMFIDTIFKIVTLINKQVTVTETDEVFIADKKIISESIKKLIISCYYAVN